MKPIQPSGGSIMSSSAYAEASQRETLKIIKQAEDLNLLVDHVYDYRDDKLGAAAQAELQKRLIVAMASGTRAIKESVDAFSEASKQQALRIEAAMNDFNKTSTRYARVLLGFTVVQALCAIAAVIMSFKR